MNTLPSLEIRLADPHESQRALAAEDAGFDDHVEDIAPLVARLTEEPSRFVREGIFLALGRMTHASIADHAVALLESDDAFLRNAAVTLLRSRGPSVVARLIEPYARADADVRKFLLDAVSGISGQQPERLLLLGIEDPDINVRIAAIEHLGERVRPELKPNFETIFSREDDPMLLSTVLTALEQVGDGDSWSIVERRYPNAGAYPPHLVPQLLRLMAKWGCADSISKFFELDARIRKSCLGDWLDALESFHDRFRFRAISPEHFNDLRAEYDSCTNVLNQYRLLKWLGRLDCQPGLLDLLVRQLAHENVTIRKGAVLGIARTGTEQARAALLSHLSLESDAEVRAMALGTLAEHAEVRAS